MDAHRYPQAFFVFATDLLEGVQPAQVHLQAQYRVLPLARTGSPRQGAQAEQLQVNVQHLRMPGRQQPSRPPRMPILEAVRIQQYTNLSGRTEKLPQIGPR